MGKFSRAFNNFARGEISPKLEGRFDLEEYFRALRTCENWIVTQEAGVMFRPSTRYFTEPTNSPNSVALIPFIVSKTVAYIIVVKNTATNQFQIIKNDGTAATLGITEDGWGAITDTNQIRFTQSADVLYLCHPELQPLKIVRDAGDVFYIVPWNWQTVHDGVGGIGLDNGLLSARGYPFRDRNLTARTLTPGATTGSSVTLTASEAYFVEDHVGAVFKLNHSGTEGVILITDYTSSTVVEGTVLVDFGATTDTTNWAEGAWSPFRGYPRAVGIFEQRLFFLGNEAQPDTAWASMAGNFDILMQSRLAQDSASDTSGLNYFGSSAETDPVSYTLASNEVNQGQWLSPGRGTLALGTLGQEYRVNGAEGRIVSSTAVSITPQTAHGSAYVDAVRVGQSTVFVQRDGKRLRELNFDFESNADFAADLNLMAEHVVRHNEDLYDFTDTADYSGQGFKQLIVDKRRGIVWGRTTRDYLVGLTMNPDLGVLAWHRHNLGGTSDGTLPPKIISMCAIPNAAGTAEEIYLAVSRQIDGNSVIYIEKIGADFENVTLDSESTNDDDHPWFLDCGVRLTNATAQTTWTSASLAHLVGETVTVIGDGKVLGEVAVTLSGSDGTLTTPKAVSRIIVGFPYTGTGRLPRIEAGGDFGQSHGIPQKIDSVMVKLFRSHSLKFGVSKWDGYQFTDNVSPVRFFHDGQTLGGALDLFSGDKEVKLPSTLGGDTAYLMFKQDQPLPCHILGMTLRGVTNG